MISERLKKIILGTLKLEDFDLQDEMSAYQIPGWDSLNHISIILAIEEGYGIRFTLPEVLALKNLGDLQELVDRKKENAN